MKRIADQPVPIRGTTYPDHAAAAKALGVKTSTVTAALRYGTLEKVGAIVLEHRKKGRPTKMTAKTYNGQQDAEHILETTLNRRRCSVALRDALQLELEKLVRKYGCVK